MAEHSMSLNSSQSSKTTAVSPNELSSVTHKLEKASQKMEELSEQAITFAEFAGDKIYDIFQENIPIEEIKEVPNPFWRNILGILACVVMLTVFLYFVISSKIVLRFIHSLPMSD